MGILSFLNPRAWSRRRVGLAPTARADLYGGDVHPVGDMEGVGAYVRQLAEVGIRRTDQLLAYPAVAVAAAIDTPEKRVRTWQATAELAAVDGIGLRYAETLARGGVEGIRDLISRDAGDLADHVNRHLASLGTKVAGEPVSASLVCGWQQAARGMKPHKVRVRLSDDAVLRDGRMRRESASVSSTSKGGPVTRRDDPRTKASAARRAAATQSSGTSGTTGATETDRADRSTASSRSKPPCAAVTAAGNPCRRTAQDGGEYCPSHGGRAPAKAKAARSRDEGRPSASGRAAGDTRRVHVTHNGYRLYREGNRFYFSKKSPEELRRDGAEPVYEVPADREVKVTQNGLPVLKGR